MPMKIFLVIVLLLLAGETAMGQTGVIRLVVTDATGGGLVAEVRVVNMATGVERRQSTQATGELVLDGLPAGRYRIEAERVGFSRQSAQVDLRAGMTIEERLTLRVGTLSFDVSIIAATPLPGAELEAWEVAPPVQNATAADIVSSQAVSLFDLLGRRAGSVNLNEIQGNPFQADLNYRGYTASPLLGTPQGISIYLDGVRLNQPFGDVVSWDLIPRQVISEVTILPGSNPIFGLNTLGGALVMRTKDGQSQPGTSINFSGGSFGRLTGDVENGGSTRSGLHWYAASSHFFEDGWRTDSPSNVRQFFSKLGWQRERSAIGLTLGFANNSLIGNGLQERRLLDRDYRSIYTKPDLTSNRSPFIALNVRHALNSRLVFAGNGWYRSIRTATLNGDINEESLDQSLYALTAEDRTTLRDAGYQNLPLADPTPATDPFPFWPCLAHSIRRDEPAEKCNGLINRTNARQTNYGVSGQVTWAGWLKGQRNQLTAGTAVDRSSLNFRQSSQLGYLAPDRGVVGVDSFADGMTGGTDDGEPYDTRVDLHGQVSTFSLFATDTLTVGNRWALTLAGRYNRTTIENRDQINPSNGPNPAPGSLDGLHHFARLNPLVGITFRPTTLVNLYLSYAEGNRAPTSVELGCADPAVPCKLPNAMAGDPPLAQVITRTFEAGIRTSEESRLNWSLGGFWARNANDILFVASQQTGYGYFRNFGRTARQGLEAELRARIWRMVFGNSYTLLDATFSSPELVNGESNSSNNGAGPGLEGAIAIAPGSRIPLIPRHLYKAFADLQLTSRLTINFGLQAQSRSIARGNENNLHQPDGLNYLGKGYSTGFSVSQLGARFRVSRHLELHARISNVFNQRYSTGAQLGLTGFDGKGVFQARPLAPVGDGEYPLIHSTFIAPGGPRGMWAGLLIRL